MQRLLAGLLIAVLGGLASAALAAGTAAVDEFQSFQKSLHDSHSAKDWQANLEAARVQREFLNGSPDSQLEVARAELFLGHTAQGFADLNTFARMGQWVDPAPLAPDWAKLVQKDEALHLQQAMTANRTPIENGELALALPDPALLPEDIDYEARTQLFYISSVREKKIVTVSLHGEMRDFASSPHGWPVIALKIDPARGRLWVTEVALQGYAFAPQADWGRSVLLAFDMKRHALVQRVEGPRGSALGDMVLTPGGEVIVSDGEGGGVYRLAVNGTALERIDHGDFLSPQTPALAPDGEHLFVPDYVRGLAVMDLRTGQTQWISMANRFALNGIDGLYMDHRRLIATQNGTSPERVVAFRLNGALREVVAEKIIERATPTLGDPTHGVIVGNAFYYIANAGWDVIDEHGALKPGEQLPRSSLMRVQLAAL
jgi:sugar lactone lactonase YvrE